jgi:diguanylate cyclase (GGDEF)-like protein/PAS domain S-box-containing protein
MYGRQEMKHISRARMDNMRKKSTTNPPVSDLRLKAELKLSERKNGSTRSTPPEQDTARLIHELEVHQIELEIQNEQLLQSQSELESTLTLYAELYALAPVGYFTMTRDGTIRRVNLTGAKLLNTDISGLIRKRFEVFVEPAAQSTFREFLARVFLNAKKESCEVRLETNGSAPLWVNIEAVTNLTGQEQDLCYAIVSDITERKHMEEELRELSIHDVLTGLYNHGFFLAELARFQRGREFPVSIVMVDVDHLKQINDKHGHSAGDELLKQVAKVLMSAFRSEDVVARIGGDEFAVLLPATNAPAADISLQRVRHAIRENNASETEIPIHISMGVSTADKADRLTAALKEADSNMFREKRRH